jgi:hypothetical protein
MSLDSLDSWNSIICLNFIVLGLNEKHLLLYIYTHVTGSRYAIQID